MHRYNIDSESDEDENDNTRDQNVASMESQWTLEDIDKFKSQTTILLDATWKSNKHKLMVQKMLDLEHPVVTSKMVDYLLQDGVCEVLVGFITLNGTNLPRPGLNDAFSEEIKLAYRASLLLSPEIITDPLHAVLSKKTPSIIRSLFNVFKEDSSGSFYHAYRVLECLLRCFPMEAMNGLFDDGCLKGRIVDMLKYVGYSPVAEIFLIIVTLTPIPRTEESLVATSSSRDRFMRELQTAEVLNLVVNSMIDPSIVNATPPQIDISLHPSSCCQLFQDLLEKLSLEEMGNILLESFKNDTYLIESIVQAMVVKDVSQEIRQCCAKVLGFLLRRAAEPEIVCFVSTNVSTPPVPTYLPNFLYSYRESIVTAVRGLLSSVISAILNLDVEGSDGVKYSSYFIQMPFTVLRHLLIEVLVLTVESDDTAAETISVELWKVFLTWTKQYPHNNIYHALFYRLIFAILRQRKLVPQSVLFENADFVQFLVDNFIVLDEEHNANVSEGLAIRGLIMNCANAIRLQINTEQESSYLNILLKNHTGWHTLVSKLTIATEQQMRFGMGLKITSESKQNNIPQESFGQDESNQYQRFAKSLGFYEDGDWSFGI